MKVFVRMSQPHSRKIVAVIDELNLSDEITLVTNIDKMGFDFNPLGITPCLVCEGFYILGVQNICRFFFDQSCNTLIPSSKAERMRMEHFDSLGDGIVDLICIAKEREINSDLLLSSNNKQLDRVLNALNYVENSSHFFDAIFDLSHISIAVAFEYWLSTDSKRSDLQFPNLKQLLAKVRSRNNFTHLLKRSELDCDLSRSQMIKRARLALY